MMDDEDDGVQKHAGVWRLFWALRELERHFVCWEYKYIFPASSGFLRGQMVMIRCFFFFLIEACVQYFQRFVSFEEAENHRNVQDFLRK